MFRLMIIPVPSMLSSLKYMSTKLFVGGLSWGTDDQSLMDAFAHFGEVVDARVIIDRESGRSRGFGFVNFSDETAANAAISEMDGKVPGKKDSKVENGSVRVSRANRKRLSKRNRCGFLSRYLMT